MKRSADVDDTRNGKRQKTTPADVLFANERQVPDELHNDDETGFILGKIFFMKTRMFRLELCGENSAGRHGLNGPQRIHVELSGNWVTRLVLMVGDEIRLALKGVEVVKLKKAPDAGVLPYQLKYSKGVSVQIVRRPGSQQDTNKLYSFWPGGKGKKNAQTNKTSVLEGPKADDFDWFVTPAETNIPDNPKADGGNDSDATAVDRAHNSPGHSMRSSTLARSSPILPPNEEMQVASTSKVVLPPTAAPIKPQPVVRPQALNQRATSNSAVLSSAAPALVASKAARTPPIVNKRPVPAEAQARQGQSRGQATASTSAAAARPPLPAVKVASPTKLSTSTTSKRSAPQSEAAGTSGPKQQMSKRQRRRLLQAQKEAAAQSSGTAVVAPEPHPRGVSDTPAAAVEVNIGALLEDNASGDAVSADLQPANSLPGPPAETPSAGPSDKQEEADGVDPVLKMRAGLRTNNGPYVPLASVQANKMVSVIGVCSSARQISKSRIGDWNGTFFLLDPSNLEASGSYLYSPEAGLMVSCFTRKYAKWLPAPNEGDVVILRMLKTVEFNNALMAKGYHDKMRWAIYDPNTGKGTHGDLGNVPRAEGLADGDGLMFSPFWDPTDVELAYCARLQTWWLAVQNERKAVMGTQIYIGGENANPSASRGRGKRQHRLIADTTPGTEPDGYFDCTVEVLQGFMNNGNPYTIYVTDYTANSGLHPATANWCPGNLADKCLKIELWDGAAGIGPDMKPGEYWSFSNVRMIVSGNGYSEAKFKEAHKAEKLAEIDAVTNHNLKLLLERKKEWEKTNTSPNEFPHRLLSDVKELEIFDSTVEVLHSIYDPKGFSEVFVTDYTTRNDLAACPSEDWSRNLANRIVKVELRDGQSDFAKKMDRGSFFKIQNLRLRERKMAGTGKLVGYLGGNDRLIMKLNPNNEENKELAALLARRADWQNTGGTSGSTLKSARPSVVRKGYSSIRQILESTKCPGRFRLRARVVDFYPLSLKDCILALCKKCHNKIPANRAACVACNDMLLEHVCHVYQLFLRIEDEDGDVLQVAIDENWADLAGLSPDEIVQDAELLNELRERLLKYIGNLEEVHDALERETTPPETRSAFHDFTIISWPIPDVEGKVGYGLR
ncbi:hypothetical protein DENSPDRAFT_603066 [Dentipellis sp. KUC8613]|nr:hypothetical protein DENSPDRAFT_603066 [Dentipellis sp. KUC8613]